MINVDGQNLTEDEYNELIGANVADSPQGGTNNPDPAESGGSGGSTGSPPPPPPGSLQTLEDVQRWFASHGVGDIAADEAKYIYDKYGPNGESSQVGLENILNQSLPYYTQRELSGGDRSAGGYDTNLNDPSQTIGGYTADARYDSNPYSMFPSAGNTEYTGPSLAGWAYTPQGWSFNGAPPATSMSSWLSSSGSSNSANPTNPFSSLVNSQNDLVKAIMAQTQSQIGAQSDYTNLLHQMFDAQQSAQAEDRAAGKQLYNTLLDQSKIDLNFNADDPLIAKQVDAYRAEQTRGARNSVDARAESGGPYANLDTYERMANETAAQHTGAFQAELMGRELSARRDQITNRLNSMAGLLTADEQRNLQAQIQLLDNAIAQQQVGLAGRGSELQEMGLNNDLQKTLLQNSQFYSDLGLRSRQVDNQNSQFYSNLGQEWDQFMAQLGFNETDRDKYWAWVDAHPNATPTR